MASAVINKGVLEGVNAVKSFITENPKASKIALIALAVFAGLAIASGVLAGINHPLNLDGFNISVEGLEGFAAGSGALSLIIGGIALKNLHAIEKKDADSAETVKESSNASGGVEGMNRDMFPCSILEAKKPEAPISDNENKDISEPTVQDLLEALGQ